LGLSTNSRRRREVAILLVYLPLLEARKPKYFGFKNQMYRERKGEGRWGVIGYG
jgi:hypothetical protein